MKNFVIYFALVVAIQMTAISQSESEVYNDSCVISKERVNFTYLKYTLSPETWLTDVVKDMQSKAGTADWFLITYSGGNIALIRQVGQNLEGYDLITREVGKIVFYSDYYALSLGMINSLVKPGESIIVSDSEEALNKMATELKTVARYSKELIKFKKL